MSGSNEAFRNDSWQFCSCKDWKERYLDIQARHSRALSRTQASVKCVSHKCLLHWGQCVCIGVYSKSVCACQCVEMLFMGQGDLYRVQWALSLAEGEPLYRHAQPSPRARLSSGVLMKCWACLTSGTSPSYFPLQAYNSKYFFQVYLRVSGGTCSNNPFFVFYFYFLRWKEKRDRLSLVLAESLWQCLLPNKYSL